MNQYIVDTKYAAKILIDTIHKEENLFEELSNNFDKLKNVFDHLFWEYSYADMYENDVQLQYKFIQMAKFAEENNLTKKKEKLDKLSRSILAKTNSMNSLSMSLLQIAKQGISTVFGNLKNCPDGRDLGSESLKNIIWEARNQALHCEEGNPRQNVRNCFANLLVDFGENFDLSKNFTENKAKNIINILDWHSYENYENDMILLIG